MSASGASEGGNVRFSERKGLRKVRSAIQIDSVDKGLRDRLWNLIDTYGFPDGANPQYIAPGVDDFAISSSFIRLVWDGFFRLAVNEIPLLWGTAYKRLKEEFDQLQWYEVYDFLEFVRKEASMIEGIDTEGFAKSCNRVLENEMSGYRFVGSEIAEIINGQEIAAIEEALSSNEQSGPVETHLDRALELLADRQSPDYRNSIKESISAVEASCREAVGDKNATLGDALKKLKANTVLHPALETAFQKLYGYTSDANGIRHALKESSGVTVADARFMLVVSSAFINLLRSKMAGG